MRSADDWFLYNCWYAAAWTSEIEDGQPLARTYLEKPIVIYRGEDGQYVALDNRCCHRSAPLAMGRIEGNCIRCMYHGMKYDASGQCVEIPGQAKISPTTGCAVTPWSTGAACSGSGWVSPSRRG